MKDKISGYKIARHETLGFKFKYKTSHVWKTMTKSGRKEITRLLNVYLFFMASLVCRTAQKQKKIEKTKNENEKLKTFIICYQRTVSSNYTINTDTTL